MYALNLTNTSATGSPAASTDGQAQRFYQKLGRMKADLIRGLMDGSDAKSQTDLAHIETIQHIQNKLLVQIGTSTAGQA